MASGDRDTEVWWVILSVEYVSIGIYLFCKLIRYRLLHSSIIAFAYIAHIHPEQEIFQNRNDHHRNFGDCCHRV
ncbi:hypothetical protein M378DRAFT_437105 [Amanita muscaria Koide BX008]|uniref:Uncharacterized protein n=1 Tax=Amanita muscaria (strain Koide BX008) TaxID=946122 RepID=A0A0C2WJE6_AMAMK|nr:hypothetical protein M378DRAFT_437105 [Amanita muscaria Koide BX008]